MDTQQGPGVGEDSEPTSDGARYPAPAPGPSSAQLRFFQVLSALLLVVLLACAGYYVYRERHVQPVTILINGKPVATVVNYATGLAVVNKVAAQQLGDAFAAEGKPRIAETVQFQHVPSDSPLDTEDAAVGKLAAVTHVTVDADVIKIDGHSAVALPDKDAALAALDAVRKHYADMPPADTVVDKPSFRETVTIERERIPAKLCIASPDQAAQALLTPPPAKTYVVQQHETGWSIARKFHLSFTDFIRANSGRDLDHLAPGDTVNVSQTFPPLTVIVKKETSATEPIIKGAPEGSGGERQVTSIITYINGVRTGESTPVGVYTLRRAVPRRSID